MKKILAVIIVIAIIIFGAPAITEYFSTNSTAENTVTDTIPEGATITQIADILHDCGVIDNKIAFRLKVKLSKYNNKLNWGTYTLDSGMSLTDVVEHLGQSGNQNTVVFVVPEGFSAQNIAERAESIGICTKKDFLSALSDNYDYEFINFIPNGKYDYKLQGFLFPDTYSFDLTADAHTIINAMLANFDAKYKQYIGEYDSKIFETIIKASLVEKEAKLERERPTIAGVIENRLKIDMPLQIDAAIVYAETDGIFDLTGVTYNNLEVNSPYNIYKNKGLPPGPICNPGISAIKAAAKPQNHNFLYYHTDNSKNDGSHIFTQTYEQHLDTMN